MSFFSKLLGRTDRPRLWWREEEPKAVAAAMTAHVDDLRRVGSYNGISRRQELAAWRSLYLDRPSKSAMDLGLRTRRSPFNLTQGGVDALHAKITVTRPRPQIVSVGGRWKQQRKSKLLQRWIDGEYDRLKAYKLLANLVHDAEIYGTGWLKCYGAFGRVQLMRVWDGDIYLDPREERFGGVRTLYHVCAIDREELWERFPEGRAAIEKAPPAPLDESMPFDDLLVTGTRTVDMITVIEGWHLGPGEDVPGRHVMAIHNGVLASDEWTHPHFPFVCYAWARDPERMRGQGVVERGAGIQLDLDEHESVMIRAYDTFVPRWAIPAMSNVSFKKLNDDISGFVYDGVQPPTVLAPPAVSPDFVNHGDRLAQRYYRVTGISEMEAQSLTSSNLSSGKAIMAHEDVTSMRFLQQGRDYEQASVDLSRLVLATADELAEDEAAALKVYGIDKGAELIDYRDARMGSDEYVVRVFPASKLPDTIAGRQETIGILMDRKIITDPQVARDLMDLPDLERHQDLASAKRANAERQIDLCLDGEQGLPSPYMDLAFAIERAVMVLNDAQLGGAEEDDPEAMERLRSFIGAAEAMMNPPAPPAAPGQPPAPAGPPPPGGEPMPMPADMPPSDMGAMGAMPMMPAA